MTFAYLMRDWLICGVLGGINQSRARFVKDIMNSEKCYVIYLLRIIDIFVLASRWIIIRKSIKGKFNLKSKNIKLSTCRKECMGCWSETESGHFHPQSLLLQHRHSVTNTRNQCGRHQLHSDLQYILIVKRVW